MINIISGYSIKIKNVLVKKDQYILFFTSFHNHHQFLYHHLMQSLL